MIEDGKSKLVGGRFIVSSILDYLSSNFEKNAFQL